MHLLFTDLDDSLIERLMETEEFYDGLLRIVESVVRAPFQSNYNTKLCASAARELGFNSKATCSMLLTYALI